MGEQKFVQNSRYSNAFPLLSYRNQGACGSCYAFSSMGMLESRLRVQTNNTLQVQLSPQDVVSCSQLSQGCDGGFPYLIAGKYAKVGSLLKTKVVYS